MVKNGFRRTEFLRVEEAQRLKCTGEPRLLPLAGGVSESPGAPLSTAVGGPNQAEPITNLHSRSLSIGD